MSLPDTTEIQPMAVSMPKLAELLDLLRATGFEISPAISLDIARIMPEFYSFDQMRLSLRMVICTTKQQQDLFDFIWNILYREVTDKEFNDEEPYGEPENSSSDLSDLENFDNLSDLPLELPESITDAEYCPNPGAVASGTIGSNDPSVALIRFASDMKGPAKQMIQGNYENAAAILLRYLLTASGDIAKFGIQRQQALAEIEEMLDYAVADHSKDLLQKLDARLDELLKERLNSGQIIGRNKLRVQKLEELPLITLQSSPELHQALRQLGKKLASQFNRKKKKGRRKINLRQTIRANIQHGGTLLELKRQNKRVDKPKLVILTDVSSSTIKATRMFLTILWHAKHIFSDIRFFEFIASVIDVTADWKRADSVDEAVDAALERWDQQTFGKQNSDYHQAFSMFSKEFGHSISSRDTIIILGDLRDWLGPWKQETPVSATVMSNLADLSKRMIVLNPESKSSWNTGDSIVQFVQSKGIEVYETNTLTKLIDVMLDLV